jgi:hypothetical protein
MVMRVNWSGWLVLVLFLGIAGIAFILWVGSITIFWVITRLFGITGNLWAIIEALSTALAAAAVFSAGFIAYRELTEMASSRHLDVADKLFNELNSQENIKARRWIFQNLPKDPEVGMKNLTPEGQSAIKQVLNSLDRVSFLTQTGWIPDEVIMPWMHPMIAKSWEKLHPYVVNERERRNETYYYEHAEILAARCNNWREKNRIETEIKWIEDAL